MKSDGMDAAWAAVRAAEPDCLDRDEVEAVIGDVRRVRAGLDGVERRCVRRLRELEAAGESGPAESVLSNAGGRSGRYAAAAAGRDDLCEESPEVADALDEGAIGGEYVDAIAAAARDLPDDVRSEFTAHSDTLLERASKLGLDAFRRECRSLAKHLLTQSRRGDVDELREQRTASTVKRWTDKVTGMCHTHLELDPVRDAKLQSAWQANIVRLRQAPGGADLDWQQLQVEAFLHSVVGTEPDAAAGAVVSETDAPVDVASSAGSAGREPAGAGSSGTGARVRRGCSCGGGGRTDRSPEITVVIDYQFLAGLTEVGVCETEGGIALPVSSVRRLACDAEVIPTVLGRDGQVLDHGRSRRTASRDQRRALRALHRTCAHPDCSVGFDWCRLHHIRWWWRDRGPTDLDNLIPLCERHHHLVHEGGWGLTMTPDRVATWVLPNGAVYHAGSTVDRCVDEPLMGALTAR